MKKSIDLSEFFNAQRNLDLEIIKEKHLTGRELLSKKRFALISEFAEMGNELPETYKFWSNKRNDYDKAIVELVDAFHFILSIGLEFGKVGGKRVENVRFRAVSAHAHLEIEEVFTAFVVSAADLRPDNYVQYVNDFLALIDTLGFAWDDFVQAYYAKNEVNLTRQESGY